MTLTQILLLLAAVFTAPHLDRKWSRVLAGCCLLLAVALIIYTKFAQ